MDLAPTVLRPFARTWLQRVQSELSLLPVPSNAARQHVPGPDADRVLIFGNGPATGFGVRSQELGLPGHLARELARSTERGVEVDLGRGRGMTIESSPSRLDRLRLQRYDAVVVTLGATDAGGLLPEARWERAVRALLAAIRERTAPATPIVWLGIRPQARTPQGIGVFDRLVDRHASRLDAVTARIVEDEDDADLVLLEPVLQAIGETRYFSTTSYLAIAEAVVAVVAPALHGRHRDGTWARIRQDADVRSSEERRQRAVDETGIAARPASARLERLVRSASDLFGTSGAAVTIIDGDRQVHKASIGLGTEEMPRRLAVCDRTIERDGALIIGDATSDPLASGSDMRTLAGPVRFYAGYPIETPDGYRLGALCVFDEEARSPGQIDEQHLRDLALRVQNELWEEIGWTPAI